MAASPPTTTPPEAPPEARETCPRCGAPYSSGQEYCLECGLRLPVQRGLVPALGHAWQSRIPWYPGDWIWPALLGLVIAAAGAAVAIATSHPKKRAAQSVIVATNPPVATATSPALTAPEQPATTRRPVVPVPRPRPRTTPPAQTHATLPKSPPITSPAKPTPKPAPRPAPKPAPAVPDIVEWPAGKSGYTVVLASLPTSSGLAAARDRARQALAARLPSVGVLLSSRFSSLHPGYYVVFSGVYPTLAAAQRAAVAAAARYANAYARQITP